MIDSTRRPQQGFTMIELMITLVIVAILAGIAVPSFTLLLERRAVQAESSRLVKGINLARSKAVTGGVLVTMERLSNTNNDWSDGWIIFVDGDGIVSNYAADDDELIARVALDSRNITLLSNAGAPTLLSFNAQGRLVNAATQFAACNVTRNDGIDDGINGTAVAIGTTGRVNVSTIPSDQKDDDCAL